MEKVIQEFEARIALCTKVIDGCYADAAPSATREPDYPVIDAMTAERTAIRIALSALYQAKGN